MERNPHFDSASHIEYSPSVLTPIVKVFDDDGQFVRQRSDVEIIRNKLVTDSAVLTYTRSVEGSILPPDNTPLDQFAQSAVPRSVTTITDAYQYGKYLESQSKEAEKVTSKLKKVSKTLSDEKVVSRKTKTD